VTLGLIHGSAPHAFVLCHLAGSTEIEGYPGHSLGTLPELVELHERIALPARPAKVAAIALNTRHLDERAARAAIADASAETGLPRTTRSGSGQGGLRTRCSRSRGEGKERRVGVSSDRRTRLARRERAHKEVDELKRLTALLAVAAALAVVGGVAAADSGPLARRPSTTPTTRGPAPRRSRSRRAWGAGFVQNIPKYFIDCPFACIRPFDTGATLTLTATPTPGTPSSAGGRRPRPGRHGRACPGPAPAR
jgi:hypothetical protein